LPCFADPFAILFDEGFDLLGPCTPRYNDFDTPARIDLDGQPSGTCALTNVKARLGAGLIVFREQ
jgi:hypothetical protein